jgi:hypothetical protein
MPFSLFCEIIGVLILSVIFHQDLKYRAVSWILFPVLGIVYAIRFYLQDGAYMHPLFNYSFLLVQIGGVSLYVLLRYKSTQLFRHYLGLGDILYWVVIAWFFSPLNFILYHLVSLTFSIFVYAILLKSEKKTVPLAGLQSLVLIVFTFLSWFSTAHDTYNDNLILTLLE